METGQKIDTKSLLAHNVDTVALLSHMSHNISQLRRDQIRPALKADYASISSSTEHTNSKFLFGEDLPRRLRDAKESSKISNTMAHSTRLHGRKPFSRVNYPRNHRPFDNPFSQKQGRIFYGKARLDPTEKRTYHQQERDNKNVGRY